VLLILAQGLPLAWRRRRPLLVFGIVLAANTAYYAIAFPPSQFDFGLPIALFTVAAERSQRTSLLSCVTVLVLFTAQWAGGVGVYWASADWVRVLYLVFFFSAVWAWGRYVRYAGSSSRHGGRWPLATVPEAGVHRALPEPIRPPAPGHPGLPRLGAAQLLRLPRDQLQGEPDLRRPQGRGGVRVRDGERRPAGSRPPHQPQGQELGYNVELIVPAGQWDASQGPARQFEQAFEPLG
jgi:hypothetical protein